MEHGESPMSACRTSFVQTSSTMVTVGQCRLVSIHAVLTGTNPTTIKVYDVAESGDAGASNELARVIVQAAPNGPTIVEFDMHGVIAVNGLYLEIATGSGIGAAVSVEFS